MTIQLVTDSPFPARRPLPAGRGSAPPSCSAALRPVRSRHSPVRREQTVHHGARCWAPRSPVQGGTVLGGRTRRCRADMSCRRTRTPQCPWLDRARRKPPAHAMGFMTW